MLKLTKQGYYQMVQDDCKIGSYAISPQHFRELVETVRISKKVTRGKMAEVLKVSRGTMLEWEKFGVPHRRAKMVGVRLREFMRSAV